jgi:hypothetical protein
MTNIIVFTPEEADGCSWYRAFGVLGFLPNVQLHRANAVTWASFAGIDIAFFQRPYTAKHVTVIELAKSMGCKIWVDYDDLLIDLPRSNPSYEVYKTTHIDVILFEADIVTVSTKTLASQFSKHVDITKLRVVPNAYNDYVLPTEYQSSLRSKPVVMWRGTNSHQGDLHEYADELNDAIYEHSDTDFVFVGYDPWMLDHTQNMHVCASRDLFSFFNLLVDYTPDILIVPLESNIFNMCKSNIAQLELARCGVTVVGPSWLEWDKDLTHMVYYDQCNNLSVAIQRAKEERAKLTEDVLRAKWESGLDRNRLSKVNELRANVIKELL